MDPIEQFEIKKLLPLFKIGATEFHFTNSAAFMILAVGLTMLLMLGATAKRELVPGRLQAIAEICYEFVANTIRSTAGEEGMKFFPFVFSLFTIYGCGPTAVLYGLILLLFGIPVYVWQRRRAQG